MGFFDRLRRTAGCSDPKNAADSIKQRLFADRTLFIGSPISDDVAREFCDSLRELVRCDRAPVTIYINSPGGVVAASERIMDAIEESSVEIVTICIGFAAGTAANLLACGRRRYVTPGATVQFVPTTAGSQHTAEELKLATERLVARLCRDTQLDARLFEQWIATQARLTAHELLACGFAHSILESLDSR